jgi:hypothetical protein
MPPKPLVVDLLNVLMGQTNRLYCRGWSLGDIRQAINERTVETITLAFARQFCSSIMLVVKDDSYDTDRFPNGWKLRCNGRVVCDMMDVIVDVARGLASKTGNAINLSLAGICNVPDFMRDTDIVLPEDVYLQTLVRARDDIVVMAIGLAEKDSVLLTNDRYSKEEAEYVVDGIPEQFRAAASHVTLSVSMLYVYPHGPYRKGADVQWLLSEGFPQNLPLIMDAAGDMEVLNFRTACYGVDLVVLRTQMVYWTTLRRHSEHLPYSIDMVDVSEEPDSPPMTPPPAAVVQRACGLRAGRLVGVCKNPAARAGLARRASVLAIVARGGAV